MSDASTIDAPRGGMRAVGGEGQIRGNRAHLVSLSYTLVRSELKLRYADSVLGYFWTLSKPIVLFGILYFAFSHVMKFGAGIPHYPVMLMLAIVLWICFSEITMVSLRILVSQADVIRKVSFPRVALPIAASLTSMVVTSFNLVAVFVFLFVSGVEPHLSWLLFPLLLVELYVLALGVGMLLSVAFVGLRDVGQVWDLGLQVIFYMSPVVYPLVDVPEQYRMAMMLVPFGQIVQHSREVLVGPASGTVASVLPNGLVAIPIVASFVLFGLGIMLFRRVAPRLAEQA